jgi:hypothetical protein
MSFTGISNLDRSIDKTNAWLAEIAVSGGALDEALDVLPPDLSRLVEPSDAAEPAAGPR